MEADLYGKINQQSCSKPTRCLQLNFFNLSMKGGNHTVQNYTDVIW